MHGAISSNTIQHQVWITRVYFIWNDLLQKYKKFTISPGRLFPHPWDNMLRIVADIMKIEVHMYRTHIKSLTRNILSYVLVENKFCVIAFPIPYPKVDNFPWCEICSFANDISNSSNIPAISPLCTYKIYYCLWNTNVIWRKMTMLTHCLTGQTLKICVVVICLTGKSLAL